MQEVPVYHSTARRITKFWNGSTPYSYLRNKVSLFLGQFFEYLLQKNVFSLLMRTKELLCVITEVGFSTVETDVYRQYWFAESWLKKPYRSTQI